MNRRAFIVVGAALAAGYGVAGNRRDPARLAGGGPPSPGGGQPAPAVRTAIAYAAAQRGKPYLWGGTGPDAFDCSGLVMAAWAHAGVTIPRTSQEQWAGLPHVTSPQPGDLVFFPGSDGTWASPGHVGLVTGPGQMIQAYAPGTPIGACPFGTSSALSGTRASDVIGYGRPRSAGR